MRILSILTDPIRSDSIATFDTLDELVPESQIGKSITIDICTVCSPSFLPACLLYLPALLYLLCLPVYQLLTVVVWFGTLMLMSY